MPGPEAFLGVLRRPDRARPPGLGDLQHHAAGQQAAAHRRERRPARPPDQQPVRVRHRPRLVVDRGARLRHPERRHDQGHVARDDPRDPEDVEGRHLQLRRRVLPHARAQGVPQAQRAAAPRHVGGGRQPRHLHRGRRAGPRRVLLLDRRARRTWSRCSRRTSRRSSNATPVGDYVNDNIMGVTNMLCMEDRNKAFEIAVQHGHELLLDAGLPLARQRAPAQAPARVAEQDPRAHARAGRAAVGRGLHRRRRPRRLRPVGAALGRHGLRPAHLQPHHQHAAHRGGRRVDGAVRPRGHPAVRHRPRALDHPLPARGRRAQADPASSAARAAIRIRPTPTEAHDRRGERRRGRADSFNMADVWEMAADAVPEREALVVRRPAPHLRRARGPGQPAGQPPGRRGASVPATTSRSTSRTAPSTSRRCWRPGSCGPCRSTSTTGTSPTSCATCSTTATRSAVITQPSLAATVAAVVARRARRAVHARRRATTTRRRWPRRRPSGPCVAGRGDDDHYVIYTGGTTGMPKGVVWRHDDAFYACMGGGDPMRLHGPVERPDELPDAHRRQPGLLPAAGADDARRRPVDLVLVAVRRRQGRAHARARSTPTRCGGRSPPRRSTC